MTTPRRTPRPVTRSAGTGLASRRKRDTGRDGLIPDRGTDALLAKAREAGTGAEGPDESTLNAVQSLLRDV